MAGVCDGVRVLDLSRYLAGPYCAGLLADMGAEVIRIENPGGAEDRTQGPPTPVGNLRYLMVCRNKKGITLDMDKPKGRDIFNRMVALTDVVVENYSPPVKEKLGVTYEALRKRKQDIIVATISGFGTDGPKAHRLGFDHIAQAESGLMSFTGFADSPPTRAQVNNIDLSTAAHAAVGIMAALLHRYKTGEGQWVETALLDTAVAYLGLQGTATEYQLLGINRRREGNAGYYHYADSFAAKDGMVMIATISTPLWRRLAKLIGHAELLSDPRFADDTSRYQNRELISPFVAAWVAERSVDEVISLMAGARIPCGRVNDIPQMVADEQVQARELFSYLDVPPVGPVLHPRMPLRLSATPLSMGKRAPAAGEDNAEIYGRLLGITEGELAALQAEGVV